MADLDLRPLTLGEILDRTFTLYRRNFLLFVGIIALPHLLILAYQLLQIFLLAAKPSTPKGVSATLGAVAVVGILVGFTVYVVAYLFAQGGTVYAVSELYLGRATSIRESLGRMRGQLGSLLGVVILNGLAVGAATLLLIIPGIYIACRLIICVPAALLENLGPRDSLERSFALTKDNAGRAFVIYLLYFTVLYGAGLLCMFPFLFAAAFSMKDPSMVRLWTALGQVGNFVATVLVTPIFTVATAVFYYDLRVRKEAFDLQLMMNPTGLAASGAAGVPNMLT
jgi:hypothetical protein